MDKIRKRLAGIHKQPKGQAVKSDAPLHVHMVHPPDPADLSIFQFELAENIRLSLDPAEIAPDTHFLVAGRPTREQILACGPNLRALVIPFAGVPEVTRDVLREFPNLVVYNLHHNALPTAEMAITLMLAAAKFIVPMDQRFRRGDWGPRYEPDPAITLAGKTALILGWGEVGKWVGRHCGGLGMDVLATKRTPPFWRDHLRVGSTKVHPPTELHHLLPHAQVLINCLPLTDETRGLIGAEELKLLRKRPIEDSRLLPKTPIVVNVGRAATFDEEALYTALTNGTVYAAGLDVWYAYPPDENTLDTPPSRFPFHELPNVVMSPHRAGKSMDIERIRLEHLADLLNAAAWDKPMPDAVDLNAGY